MSRWIFLIPLVLSSLFCVITPIAETATPDVSVIVRATLTAYSAGPASAGSTPLSTAPTPDLSAMVNGTLTAIASKASPTTSASSTPASAPTNTAPVPTNTVTPTETSQYGRDFIPPLGTITGTLSYPGSGIPALRIVARSTLDGSVSYTETAAGQGTYSLDLPAGPYTVVAYTLGGGGYPTGLGGGYTQAVPCGLSVSCTDHTLIVVTVTANVTTSNVNPQDWYAPSGTFPPMPTP